MKKLPLSTLIISLAGVIIFALGWWWLIGGKAEAYDVDAFAKCLADKNITMYGADWCSHCQNEKTAFGEAFRHVPYVECPQEVQRCLDLGIKSYPTWVMPDGQKLVGEQGLKKLSQASGCQLTP